MRRLGVVLNPAAGGGRCGKAADAALAALAELGEVSLRRTEGPGHATALAEALAPEVDVLVAIGGDGTLHEVVNGLMRVEAPPPFALIPLGTGNSFGRDVGVTDLPSAIAAIEGELRRPVDVVLAEHQGGALHFINLLSVGFAADAGATTNRRFKGYGALGYVLAVLVELTRLAPRAFPFAVDAGPLDAEPVTLLSFSNSRYTGGDMLMAPTARVDDGRLDVVRIGAMSRRRLLTCFPKIFAGTHVAMPEVSATTAAEVRLELPEPVMVMVDGEALPLALRRLVVLPGALTVCG